MKKLEETLVEILNKTTAAIDKGMDFATDQIPDVITQLLLWYGVYNFILFISGVSIIIGTLIIFYKLHKSEFVANLKDSFVFYFPSMVIVPIILITGSFLINLTWLKVWIAPKLFLIEYMSNVVKG